MEAGSALAIRAGGGDLSVAQLYRLLQQGVPPTAGRGAPRPGDSGIHRRQFPFCMRGFHSDNHYTDLPVLVSTRPEMLDVLGVSYVTF